MASWKPLTATTHLVIMTDMAATHGRSASRWIIINRRNVSIDVYQLSPWVSYCGMDER